MADAVNAQSQQYARTANAAGYFPPAPAVTSDEQRRRWCFERALEVQPSGFIDDIISDAERILTFISDDTLRAAYDRLTPEHRESVALMIRALSDPQKD